MAATATAPASPPDDRVPDLAHGTWRAATALRPLLAGGAVLRIDPDNGGFILEASSGAELARASRTSELAALLDGIAGKVKPKGRVILSIGKLLPDVARVRFAGESLNALVRVAVAAEVARRTAAFDAEGDDLDAAGGAA